MKYRIIVSATIFKVRSIDYNLSLFLYLTYILYHVSCKSSQLRLTDVEECKENVIIMNKEKFVFMVGHVRTPQHY